MFYTKSLIDRLDHLRKDEATLQTLRSQADTRLVLVREGKSLTTANSAEPAALTLPSVTLEGMTEIFLGKDDAQHHYFAVDVSPMDDAAVDALIQRAIGKGGDAPEYAFRDLRTTGPLLSPHDGSLLAYAKGLVYWNENTRHCIRCGNLLSSSNGGHVKQCPTCDHVMFPRTDPAVIMLVTHEQAGQPDKCLLGRSPVWPEGVFSALAGFVEPGESLEMAVQREVLEEASIHTEDVRYITSQPWPFPRSIMLGFEARATSTDIVCDPTELDDAKWFTKEQLLTFANWGDDIEGYKLPRTDSIARFLIDRWIKSE